MTKVYGITMMRDEEDVAPFVLMHMLEEGLDGLIVANNLSRDGTSDALTMIGDVIRDEYPHVDYLVLEDDLLGYYQSEKMTNMAHLASGRGAEWIVPFDADEIWYGPDRIAVTLRGLRDEVRVVEASLYNHFPSDIDPLEGCPFERIVYRQRELGQMPKVAVRYHESLVIHQGNHGVSLNDMCPWHVVHGGLELRHFPYRSFEQFCRKAKNGAEAYNATNLPLDIGAHWRQYGTLLERGGEDALREVYERWFHFVAPVTAGLVLDPAPFRRWRHNAVES